MLVRSMFVTGVIVGVVAGALSLAQAQGVAPAPAVSAAPAPTTTTTPMAVPKPPRKFLINGKLRPLKPGEIRPYVPKILEPEPALEPTEITAVEVMEDEAQVLARPFYGAPMVGTLGLGARLPVRGTLLTKSAHYCPNRRWFALSPTGWVCSKQVRPTREPLTTTSVLHVPEGERLPYHYVMVSSKEPLPMWASLEDFKNGAEPERTLERGDSIAISKMWKNEGEGYYLSAERGVLPIKGTYAMGPSSEWQGVEIDDKTHLPFGWITPDKAKLLDGPGGHKLATTLARRTRVDILEETEVGRRRYLRVRPLPAKVANVVANVVAKVTPAAAPPAAALPAPAPPPDEEPSYWLAASEVNEVRRKPVPEGVNPVGQWIDIDLGEQVLVAYEDDDRPVYATLVSSGRSIPTPMGNYPMWAKVSAITMKSQLYDDKDYFVNKVPWALFFQAHNAIHGAYWHDRFGVSKSHGCANVAPLDARHIFEWIKPPLPPGWSSIRPVDLRESVTVHVYNSSLKKPFHQDRPIGPPDRDDEAERLELAEKRRAEAAAAAPPPSATPASPGAPAAPGAPAPGVPAPAAPGIAPRPAQ